MLKQKNGPGPKPGAIPTETTTSHHHEADGRFDSTAVAPHVRWRQSVQRMPLLDCGCRIRCHCKPPALTDHQLDGWADCARFVMDTAGVVPLLPLDVVRALWRRGGKDRALAEKLRGAIR